MKINLISLGCPKNRVDSEVILGRLGEKGYSFTSFSEEADIIIINTCSFIKEARKESHKVISEVVSQKKLFQKIIVCGCLPQLAGRSLFLKYPEIDALIGSADFIKIDEIITNLFKDKKHLFLVSEPHFLYNHTHPRLLTTPPSYAYLKIAEGCSHHCSYCLIPSLRGKYRSRPLKDIVQEAKALCNLGVKEIILVAQDTTFYGRDLGKKFLLSSLLEALEKLDKLRWVRLLYTHPAHFDSSLIRIIATSKKICKYIDLPLQHTHNDILMRMKRPRFEETEKLIYKLREKIPEVTLRTTLMVGFPGEEEEHFRKLLKDVKRLKFDWLGVFSYSPEKGTSAYSFVPRILSKVKMRRYKELMRLQSFITLEKNEKRTGEKYFILVDKENEGHTEFQAPEIDGKVILRRKHIPGKFIQGKISSVINNYDLAC
ncbi:30S ribosomal protein S12 methylthiotransferase RimO [Candidatus Aerophobetes bacterium]|nr:30S ribosomal protein S12 methylthiotransferase RimO [Candidatus Aerophobetes bacterium]